LALFGFSSQARRPVYGRGERFNEHASVMSFVVMVMGVAPLIAYLSIHRWAPLPGEGL